MYAFWLNGGLHLEPETQQERDGLAVLYNRLKRELPSELRPEVSTGLGSSGGGGELKAAADSLVVSQKIRPRTTAGDLGDQ